MKMESNIQPIDKIFLMKSESNERIRENTSLEKKIEEKFDNSQVCNVPTSVIHIKGLNIKEMKLAFLKNLFSNFGNVKKIIFFKEIGSALLEFTLKEFAFSAIKFLNNLMFLGTTLQVSN